MSLTAAMQVLAVTGLFCLNVRMSITLNQTVRAFLPVGVLLLATVLERRTYPRHSYYTTFVLILGIALTCWGSPHFEFNGFFLAFTSTIIAALGSSLNGRLLNAGPFSKAGPGVIARLLMYQSVPAFFVFLLVAYLTEAERVRDAFSARCVLLISISSALALMANLGRCFLVAATSALMEALAGNAKVAALCVIDHQLFHTTLHTYNYFGVAITFTGFSMHVLLQYASRQDTAAGDEQAQELAESNSKEQRTNGESHGESNGDSNGVLHVRRHTPLNQPTIRLQPRPPLSLPLQISGAETGLISEQVAVRIGKPAPKARRHRLSSSTRRTAMRIQARTWTTTNSRLTPAGFAPVHGRPASTPPRVGSAVSAIELAFSWHQFSSHRRGYPKKTRKMKISFQPLTLRMPDS